MKIHRGHVKAGPKATIYAALVLIVISGCISYANSIHNPFIFDDLPLIAKNPVIQDARNIPVLFQRDIFHHGDMAGRASGESNFYRPLQMLVYTMDYIFGKLNVVPYHISSIIFHILVALALYGLAYLVFENEIVPFVASILFVTHPIHTGVVAYISSLADSMVTFFMLLCLISYIKYSRGGKSAFFYVLSLLSFLLALLCKELAVVFPLLLMAYDYIYKGRKGMSLKRHGPFLALDAFYIFLRVTILHFPARNTTMLYDIFQRIPAIFQSLFDYIAKLLFPSDLHMEYGFVLPSVADPRVAGGILIAMLLIWTIIISIKKAKAVSFALTWFLVLYLPISNIFRLNASFCEGWIYAPSLGLYMLTGWLLFKVYERRRFLKTFILSCLTAYVCLNVYLTIRQNQTWSDAEEFYKRALNYNPASVIAHLNLGNIYYHKGNYDRAFLEYNKTIELNPEFAEAYNNRGSIYGSRGDYDRAIADFVKAIELMPNYLDAYNNLGATYMYKGDYDRAWALKKASP